MHSGLGQILEALGQDSFQEPLGLGLGVEMRKSVITKKSFFPQKQSAMRITSVLLFALLVVLAIVESVPRTGQDRTVSYNEARDDLPGVG